VLTIPNLPTQDGYVNALTLGPVPTTRLIKYVVANKAVFMRVWPQSKSGTIPAQTDELLVTPETNIITDAMGVQFRSALAGVPAQVVAQLLEPGDPTFGSGTPFSSIISGSGGISPGVSAVQIQKNNVLIGQEPTLDLLDAAGLTWTVVDDPANTRVKVTPAPVDGVIIGKFGAVFGAGFADVGYITAAAQRMMGFGAAGWALTPRRTGTVILLAQGITSYAGAAGSANFALFGGTGAAPANNVAPPGGSFGATIPISGQTPNGPMTMAVVVSGLAIGTAYWFDVAVASDGANIARFGLPTLSVIEI
jgi:hypothetical protein